MFKYIKLSFAVFSYVCFSTDSFSQTTFQKFITNQQPNVTDFPNDATVDGSKNLYLIGENDLQQTEIVKMDSLGNVIWNRSPSFLIFSATNISYTQDFNLIISGMSWDQTNNIRYTTVVKCDTAGNVLWSSYMPNIFSGQGQPKSLVEDFNSNYIFTGFYYLYDSTLLANKKIPFYQVFDSNGVLLYNKIITDSNPNNSIEIDDVTWNDQMGLVGIGSIEDLLTNSRKFLLIKFDSSFNIASSFSTNNSNGDEFAYKVISDGNYLIISGSRQVSATLHPFFLRLDSQFNIIKTNFITSSIPYGTTSMAKYNNDSYLITGNGPMLMVLDSNLSLINHLNYGPSSFNRYLVKAIPENNGFVYLFGRNDIIPKKLVIRTDPIFNSGCYSFQTISLSQYNLPFQLDSIALNVVDTTNSMISFDALINHGWGDVTLCISTSTENENFSTLGITCYPNPAFDNLNIVKHGIFTSQKWRVYIYDVLGRVVFETEFQSQVNPILLNISELIQGAYTVVGVFQEEGVFIKKFIKN